ncbi:hypothetical protein OAK87_01585 [bacterium]|mgnify:CR=1|nr:hypothetical protein [bacterium]
MVLQRAALLMSLKGFLIKISIYWFAELVVCQLDASRLICKFISKGFLPCVISFAIMDFIVLPQMRSALKRKRRRLESQDKL